MKHLTSTAGFTIHVARRTCTSDPHPSKVCQQPCAELVCCMYRAGVYWSGVLHVLDLGVGIRILVETMKQDHVVEAARHDHTPT